MYDNWKLETPPIDTEPNTVIVDCCGKEVREGNTESVVVIGDEGTYTVKWCNQCFNKKYGR